MYKKKDLFSVVVIAVVLAAGILFALVIQQIMTLSRVTENTKQDLVEAAGNQAIMLDTLLNGQADLLNSMALSISKQTEADFSFRNKVKNRAVVAQMRTLCEPSLFNFLILIAPDGNGLYTDETTRDLSGRWYFRTAKAGRTAIEKISSGHSDGKQRFVLAVPVRNSGKIVGVLAGAMEMETFADSFLPSTYSQGMSSFMINADGSILASTQSDTDGKPDGVNMYDIFSEDDLLNGYSKEQLSIDMHSEESGSFYCKYNDQRHLAVFQRMKFSIQSMRVWYIVSFTPESVIKDKVSAAMREQSFFFGVIALCTLIATTIVMWHERKNARLLREESEQLKIREHDLNKTMEELRKSEDALHLSEKTLSIAMSSGRREVIRYEIHADRCYYDPAEPDAEPFSAVLENASEALIGHKGIAEEGCEAFRAFFAKLAEGESPLSADFPTEDGEGRRWMRMSSVTVFSADGTPEYAVISIDDVTEQREKEIAYSRWQQTLAAMPVKSTTVHQWNLTSDRIESRRGEMGFDMFLDYSVGFNEAIRKLADSAVYKDDRDIFLDMMNRERLIGAFYDNNRNKEIEYRLRANNRYRWMHLSVQLVSYPDSSDIQAFFVTSDIDVEKRREMELLESREKDALTGTLNRQAFIERVTDMIQGGGAGRNHVLMIVDIDNFKSVNDNFGHIAGNRVLSETAGCLRSSLRNADLLGRLGGDEFMIFMNNVPYDAFIEKRAEQICRQVNRRVGKNVLIGASIGIAVYPRDGTDFSVLYEMADDALYKVKQEGGNSFAFYQPETQNAAQEGVVLGMDAIEDSCLIVADDTNEVLSFCAELFEGSYSVTYAESGAKTLALLRKLGQKVAALVVHLTEEEAGSRELLSWLRDSHDSDNVPVLIVDREEDDLKALQYIDAGAFDFIPMPVDRQFLFQRVNSAVHSAKRVKARAQSNFLRLQSDEEEKFRHVLEATGTVVFTYDIESETFSYDDLAGRYLAGKYDKRTLWKIFLSDMVARLSDVKQMQALCHNLAEDPEKESDEMFVQLRSANKKMRWFRMQLIKRNEDQVFTGKMLMTFNDVHDEVVTKNSMRYRAEHDILTGLLNRESFLSRVGELVSSGEPGHYVLACVDLDNFKVVNDQFGHATGDRILKDIGAKIQLLMDGCSGVCCRICADTFAAFYPAAHSEGEDDEIWGKLSRQLKQEAHPYHVTFHVGRYRIDDLKLKPELMLDRALMAQRSIHRDAVRRIADYDEAERLRMLEEQKIVGMMEWALADGQFIIYLQPQYSRGTGLISGVETLVRWNHPEQGMITPGQFIPLFEKNGFITRLDHFVWEESCVLLRRWLDEGRKIVPLSVNVSRVDIFDEGLCDDLTALIEKYELTRDMLRLEITETAYSDQPEQFLGAVGRLRNEGFLVEMDDFGSGYSSLNILKNCPIDVLKLDMGFLSDNEGESARGGNIIASVVRMARLLSLPIIAEGVETQQQADFLHSIGCDVMQGYLFAKPMPVNEFEAIMNDRVSYSRSLEAPRGDGLDMGAFWDPNSFESLMFNTYVGAAAILELRDEHFELLRANRKYLNMFNLHAGQMDEYCINFENIFMPGQRDIYYEMIAQAASSPDGEAVCVTQRRLGEQAQPIWIRTNIRLIAKDNERVEFYCIAEDVTAERETMERLTRSEDTLLATASHAQLFYWEYDCETKECIQDARAQREFDQPETVTDYPESVIREGRIAAEQCEQYRQMHEKLKQGIPEISMDVYRTDKECWYRVQYTNILDKEGKVIRTIGTARRIEPDEKADKNNRL